MEKVANAPIAPKRTYHKTPTLQHKPQANETVSTPKEGVKSVLEIASSNQLLEAVNNGAQNSIGTSDLIVEDTKRSEKILDFEPTDAVAVSVESTVIEDSEDDSIYTIEVEGIGEMQLRVTNDTITFDENLNKKDKLSLEQVYEKHAIKLVGEIKDLFLTNVTHDSSFQSHLDKTMPMNTSINEKESSESREYVSTKGLKESKIPTNDIMSKNESESTESLHTLEPIEIAVERSLADEQSFIDLNKVCNNNPDEDIYITESELIEEKPILKTEVPLQIQITEELNKMSVSTMVMSIYVIVMTLIVITSEIL